jgi:hypothetical protein
MFRVALLAAPLLLAPIALPLPAAGAEAQTQARSATGENCEQQNQRRRRRGRGIGGMLGGIAGGIVGGPARVVTSVLPVGQVLGGAIAGLLDCREQQQAVQATEEAVRGEVGTTVTWTSETRANVAGSATLSASEPAATDGSQCVTVTDIVIIDGEETRAPKRMCRRPPTNRYVRV